MSQSLVRIMQAETEAVEAFSAALRIERQAIRAGDFQELNKQIERKGAVIEMIAKLGAARVAQMVALGIRPLADDALEGAAVDESILSAWKGLTFAARGAREATEMTSAIVNAHADFTAEALQILRLRGVETSVYGPDGRTRAHQSGLSLGNV